MLPNAEHRQCSRHVNANFAKNGLESNLDNLFWEAAKCSYVEKFKSYSKGLNTSMNKLTITWEIEDLPLGVGYFSSQGLTMMQ